MIFADYSAHASDFTRLGEYGLTGIVLGALACLLLVVLVVIGSSTLQKKWESESDSEERREIREANKAFIDSVHELAVKMGITENTVSDHERRITKLEDKDDDKNSIDNT